MNKENEYIKYNKNDDPCWNCNLNRYTRRLKTKQGKTPTYCIECNMKKKLGEWEND